MANKLYVEGWAPDYGTPFEPDDSLVDETKVDESVEVAGAWSPISGRDDGVERIAFVDGIRRIDARLTLDGDDGPMPGICGSFAVGAVTWDRTARRSDVSHAQIQRVAVFGDGQAVPVPVAAAQLSYRTESIAESDPGALIQHFHGLMRKAEGKLSERIAQDGTFVIADGPINDLSATEKVGYVKTHRTRYLSRERGRVIGRLAPGERTPLFLIGAGGAYPRYSWYLRLAAIPGGHSWTGIVRAEVSSHLGIDRAAGVASRATAVLPLVASAPHIDPRAPQNLVPIGALERELRRRLGDPGFIHRSLRAAVAKGATV
jgi:hypothetical protein